MKIIKGKYNQAIVYTQNIDDTAVEQIETLCSQEFAKESIIRIMPDVHAGMGCTIGTTMTVTDRVVPNLVGVDIGCGMEVVKLSNKRLELSRLDKIIYEKIPAGFKVRKIEHKFSELVNLEKLHCKEKVNLGRARKSIGTLGGGNHFIEVNKGEDNNLWLVIHSGSRHLGAQVAAFYQEEAYKRLKDQGVHDVPKSLAYLEGELYTKYLDDMQLVQEYALVNRKAIINDIVKTMKLDVVDQFSTIHNYIDLDEMILRKGAVSAKKGERFLIPINMREGSLIAVGKGNKEWNYSAPHGAGRIMSRGQARNSLTLNDYKKSMEGIFSTSVNKTTIDEAPMAYKPLRDITDNIKGTADVVEIIRTIYNFKAAE